MTFARTNADFLRNLDFSRVVYYPAGGTDLQAILRFSGVADTILSPTVSNYLTREKYEALFRLKCATLNSHFGENLLELDEVEEWDASFIRDRKFVAAPAGLFSEGDIQGYMAAFGQYTHQDPRVYCFRFRRRIGRTDRTVKWIAMATEGLATLISIKLATQKTPKIICTFQTGALERPGGLFVRMVERTDIRPDIWVRGAWKCKDPRRESIQAFPPYDAVVQDYGYWNSSLGAPAEPNEDTHCDPPISLARAFARKDWTGAAQPREVLHRRPGNALRVIRLKMADLVAEADGYDRIFCSRDLLPAESDRVIHWEALSPRPHSAAFPDMTLPEALQTVQARTAPGCRVAMTPIGFEDESAALDELLVASNAPMDLTIFHRRRLDFWDRRLEES